MRAIPFEDALIHGGTVRSDGLMVHDVLLLQVKAPGESKAPWDDLKVVRRCRATKPLHLWSQAVAKAPRNDRAREVVQGERYGSGVPQTRICGTVARSCTKCWLPGWELWLSAMNGGKASALSVAVIHAADVVPEANGKRSWFDAILYNLPHLLRLLAVPQLSLCTLGLCLISSAGKM